MKHASHTRWGSGRDSAGSGMFWLEQGPQKVFPQLLMDSVAKTQMDTDKSEHLDNDGRKTEEE